MDDRAVEEVKARTDLAELIESYGVRIRRSGSSLKACCPFHGEKTPSFNINVAKGFYHCFGCGESGDAITFVMKQEGLTFPEALKKLAQRCGVKIEEVKHDPDGDLRKRLLALMAELSAFYRRCLLKMREAEGAREYLASRDLGPEVQEAWQIGYAPTGVATILKWAEKYGYTAAELEAAGVIKAPSRPGDQGYHRFGGRLMFSIRDRQGRVVAFSGRQLVAQRNSGKYVNSPETKIFKKSNVLFGFDRAAANIARAEHREAIVCEGQIDTIRLHTCGFPVAVAPQGTAFTEEHARMLKRVADQIVLVFDDDAAGHKASVRTAGLLLAAEMPVRVASLPGGDDPDSFLRTHPPAEFQQLLDAAESIVSFQVRVERAKERDPGSVDAVARVSKAVLETVAQCPGPVLRATMVEEAARLLSLPAAALREELEKLGVKKAAPAPQPAIEQAFDSFGDDVDGAEEPDEESVDAGEAAAAVVPPPGLEISFMAFLLANERREEVDRVLGEFLPSDVFEHELTRRFVEVWRGEFQTEGDGLAEFSGGLPPAEQRAFAAVLLESERYSASTQEVSEILHEFARRLWSACLRRRRGALPADGDESVQLEGLRLTADIKRLELSGWTETKDLIRQWQSVAPNSNLSLSLSLSEGCARVLR